MRPVNPIYAQLGTTVFETMSRLAQETGAINLGQGFPDEGFPPDVLAKAADAVLTGWNQYPPMPGLPELRQAIARHEQRFYGIDRDWMRETLVTSGATEALAAAILALVEPGDEVVLFEPFYDAYLPLVRRAGAIPRFVTLTPPDWTPSREALAAAFSPRTKAVILNNPLNPAGKVFSRAELELIAEFVDGSDAYVIADEVYEHVLYDGRAHIPFCTLPGMANRVIRIGSAGKIFSLTGWKVGLVTGAADTLSPVIKAHQYLTFTTPPNLQAAVAFGLDKGDDFYRELASGLELRRDRFAAGLRALGLEVLPCHGTYFLSIDIRSAGFSGTDTEFCQALTRRIGVAAIPNSAFYAQNPVTTTARFCFSKKLSVLDGALERLARLGETKLDG